MSTLEPNARVSFLELSKRTNDPGMLEIAEVLVAANPMLMDIPWKEANFNLMSEKILRRTSLPSGQFRQIYDGVTREASTTQVVVEPTALLEARSEIDEAIVDNAPNPNQLRRSEDIAFVEGLGQTVGQAFISGDRAANSEAINGFEQRYTTLSQKTVINNGGSSNLTSIWAVDWGFRKTYGIFPAAGANRGQLGLSVINKGREPLAGENSGTFYAFVTQFKWYIGLVVRDEDSVGRLANIESSGSSNIFDEDKLIELLNIGRFNTATTRLYLNPQIMTQAEIRLKDKGNVNWSVMQGLGGVPFMQFRGIPVRKVENTLLTNSETVLT